MTTTTNRKQNITSRERQVLHLIAHERNTNQIAEELFVSYETAISHRKSLLKKLKVKNTAGMIRVAFESGLMRVGQTAFLIIIFFLSSALHSVAQQLQPNNLDQYNYEARLTRVYWDFGGSESGLEEAAMRIAACASDDGQNTEILSAPNYTTSTCGMTPICKRIETDCESGCSIDNLNDFLIRKFNRNSSEIDIHFAKWEADGTKTEVNQCQYVSGHDEFGDAFSLRTLEFTSNNTWSNDFLASTGARIDFKTTWCHSNGRKDDPFTFQTHLSQGKLFYHFNNNRKSASGASSAIGYQNDWSMTSAADVTYQFTINEPLLYSARTDHPNGTSTEFDTRLYLFDSNDNQIAFDDDSGAGLTSNINSIPLCAGTYKLVVTGHQFREGNYYVDMYTSSNAWSYNAGFISTSTTSVCSGAKYDITVSGGIPQEIKGGDPIYSWQKKEIDQVNWMAVAGTEQNLTLTDQIMPDDNLQYRRKVNNCSKVAYSNPVTIISQDNTIDGGEIQYGNYDFNFSNIITRHTNLYLRKGSLIFNGIGNKIQGNGDPSPISYSWEKIVGVDTFSIPSSNNGSVIGNSAVYGMDFDSSLPPGEQNSFTFLRRATNDCNNSDKSNDLNFTVVEAKGKIEGKVTSPPAGQGTGIEFIEVCATPDPSFGDPVDLHYATQECAITTNTGFYRIDSLYTGDPAGDGVRYIVSASYLDHDIEVNPTDREVAENDSTWLVPLKNNATQSGIHFEDNTAIAISGNVYHNYTNPSNQTIRLGKRNIEVIVERVTQTQNGEVLSFLGKDTTDFLGDYAYSLPSPGKYRITPKLDTIYFDSNNDPVTEEHVFDPAFLEMVFVDSTSHLDFKDQNFIDLSLKLGGACKRNIGSIKVDIKDKDNGNILLTEYDVNNTIQSLILPARKYEIDVSANTNGLSNNVDQAVVSNQLTNMANLISDLHYFNDTILIDIDERPIVHVTGFETYLQNICVDNATIPDVAVLDQFVTYPDIELFVSEGPELTCKLDTGSLTANIGASSFTDLEIIEGEVQGFQVTGAFPNFISPYTIVASFSAEAPSGLGSDQIDQTIFTKGAKKNGTDFISVSPELPSLILHDPPTDYGFSFIEQGSTINTTSSTFAESSKGGGAYTNLKYGVEFEAGVDVFGVTFAQKYEIFATAEVDISAAYTTSSSESLSHIISANTRIKTDGSGDPKYIGEDGDVVVTMVMNRTFSEALELGLEGCIPKLDTIIAISKDSVQSMAIRTIWDIKNVIIPDLEDAKVSANTEEEINNLNAQISSWNNLVQSNQENIAYQIKETKADSVERISIGAGVEKDYYLHVDSVYSSTFEYIMEVDEEVAVGARLILAGNGGDGKVYGKFQQRFTVDPSIENEEVISRTTGYHLHDDDAGDQYLIAIYEDKKYGTPLFNVEAGKSSCPYTAWHENPDSAMAKAKLFDIGLNQSTAEINVDPVQGHTFQFTLKNLSDSNFEFEIGKDPTEGQNSNVTLNSSNEDEIFPFLNSGQELNVSVKVKKESGADNQMIRIYIIPQCDEYFLNSKTIDFNVSYVSQISPVTIANVTPDQLIYSGSGTELDILMKEYDKSKFDRVFLEYKEEGGSNFSTSSSFDFQNNQQLGNDPLVGTVKPWDTSEIPRDGRYLIKLTTIRNGVVGTNGSQTIPIIVDRSKPFVFGLPEPIDDNYDLNANDVISVHYNENVCPNGQTSAVATIEDIGNPTTPINTVVTCNDNRLVIVEQGVSLNNRAPSLYRVKLSGVEDIYGNVADDYYWTFLVGGYDPSAFACLPEIFITNNNLNQDAINATAYRALSIISDGETPNFGLTSFKAQDEILLNAGFQVNGNGEFEAIIENCAQDEN